MSAEKAKAHYMGKPGYNKLNCAQAIVAAFKDKFGVAEETVALFGGFGGGRAPEGQCGSLYAARVMLAKEHPAIVDACESALLTHGGSIKCRDIRAAGRLPCMGCVEKVAQCLEGVGA